MQVRHYAFVLWHWLWLIIIGTLLASLTAFGISSQLRPVYESSTTLLINPARTGDAASDYTSLLASERLAKTYAELLLKRPVLDAVIANLKLDTTAETLSKRTQTSLVRDTQLIVLTVEDSDPQRAAQIANEMVTIFSQQNRELQSSRYSEAKAGIEQEFATVQADLDRAQAGLDALKPPLTSEQVVERDQLQVLLAQSRASSADLLKSLQEIRLAEAQTNDTVNIVETAQIEPRPIRPNTLINTVLGAIVGLFLTVGLIVLVDYLDDTVQSSDAVRRLTQAGTLAVIGRIGGKEPHHKLAAMNNPRSLVAEAYRLLRINIDVATLDNVAHTVLVTSSSSAEGKTTVSANLAVALAQTGKRVIVVDTDLRRPMLHTIFQVTNERGVTTALIQNDTPIEHHLTRTSIRDLYVMPSGPLPPQPAELLGSQRMAHLLTQLKNQADVVIFDSPPVLPVVDATILARLCDATIVVVLAKKTRAQALQNAYNQLVQSGSRIIGVVLNQSTEVRDNAYYSDDTQNPDPAMMSVTDLRHFDSASREMHVVGRSNNRINGADAACANGVAQTMGVIDVDNQQSEHE